jgi:probable rRNA maturation factor
MSGGAREVAVDVQDEAASAQEASAVRRAVEQALDTLGAPVDAGLTVVLAGDELLRALNRDHRGQDRPTDVLSFPAGEDDHEPGAPPYLGDVVIAVPQAEVGAAAAGHARAEELVLLAVHGVLHLLGYEDDTDAGATEMVRREIQLGVRRPDDLPDDLRDDLGAGLP